MHRNQQPTMATNSNTLQTFTAFYDGWLLRHHHLQEQLSAVLAQIDKLHHQQLMKLVEQASDHYCQYYQQKSLVIERDVFLVFSPPWFTSFEQALFWVTEFPPSLVFRFVSDLNLTTEQKEKVEAVRTETARKEREIGEAMAIVQESVAAAPLYGLVNRTERLVDGQVSELDDAMEEVKEAMRTVVMEADSLRGTTVMAVLEGLGMAQRVKLLAAVGEYRIRVRRVGLQMDRVQDVHVTT